MLKKICVLSLVIFPFFIFAQHTFSIVAVDTVTGMVGSAGGSCLDTVTSYNINRINETIPGKGSICAQASWDFTNLANAKTRMLAGDSPDAILDWLKKNDSQNNPQRMQYGIVDLNNGHARATAFSGSGAMDYKNHRIGSNYTVQGNILIGKQTIDSIELGFLTTPGSFTDKLMGALEGAAFPGADKRCLNEGIACKSAYIRAAKPTDQNNKYYLDLYVGATPYGVEPIKELRKKYNAWQTTHSVADNFLQHAIHTAFRHSRQHGIITITFSRTIPSLIVVVNVSGRVVCRQECRGVKTADIDLSRHGNGLYTVLYYMKNTLLETQKISLIR